MASVKPQAALYGLEFSNKGENEMNETRGVEGERLVNVSQEPTPFVSAEMKVVISKDDKGNYQCKVIQDAFIIADKGHLGTFKDRSAKYNMPEDFFEREDPTEEVFQQLFANAFCRKPIIVFMGNQ